MRLFRGKKEKDRCPYCFSPYLPSTQFCPLCREKKRTALEVDRETLKAGTVLNERYQLGSVLETQPGGIVYAAWDLKRERQVFFREVEDNTVLQMQTAKTKRKVFSSNGRQFVLENQYAFRKEENCPPAFQCRAAVKSEIGTRVNQEDAADVITGRDFAYGILCDGMGGMGNGALASGLCLKSLKTIYQILCFGPAAGILPQLERTIRQIDNQIAGLRNPDGDLLHCGTTLVCAVIRNGRLFYASVGDSRLYLIRSGTIRQLTEEHTLFQALLRQVKRGELTYEQAIANPRREALTSYIGLGGLQELDVPESFVLLAQSDMLLLCSDGLYRALSDEEMLSILCRSEVPSEAVQNLIAGALEKQLPHQDNLTAVVMQFIREE